MTSSITCAAKYSNPLHVSSEQVKSALLTHGIVSGADCLTIELLPEPFERRVNARRRLGRAWVNGQCKIQLYIGEKFASLAERANALYDACPSVICRPLFFLRTGGLEYFGQEFASGYVLDGHDSANFNETKIHWAISTIQEALSATEQPSTIQDAYIEIDQLFANFRELDRLAEFDHDFLQNWVLPELKAILVNSAPRTRWTNGDFITRNIIVGPDNSVRLVDYEFATRTHFFAEDWVRLITFSNLPASIHSKAVRELGDSRRAVSLYFWVRQLLLEGQIKTYNDFECASKRIAHEILGLFDPGGSRLRRSHFLRSAQLHLGPDGSEASQFQANPVLQVFYSAGDDFSDSCSLPIQLQSHGWTHIEQAIPIGPGTWYLRIDPTCAPGLIEISYIRVKSPSGVVYFEAADAADMDTIKVVGTSWQLPESPVLRLLSYANDPQLLLPPVEVTNEGPVILDLWINVRSLTEAIAWLDPQTQANHIASTMRQLEQTKQALSQTAAEVSRNRGEIGRLKTEIDESSTRMQSMLEHQRALESALTSAQSRIFGLEQSLSWKITGPLRLIGSVFERK